MMCTFLSYCQMMMINYLLYYIILHLRWSSHVMGEIRVNRKRFLNAALKSSQTGSDFTFNQWRPSFHDPPKWKPMKVNQNSSSELDFSDGLVLIVLHESSAKVLLHKTFPTWNPFAFSYDLIWWLQHIQPGRLVFMFIRKSGTYGLKKSITLMKERGSLLVEFLPPRSLWIWIWVVGGRSLFEAATSVASVNHIKELLSDSVIILSNSIKPRFESQKTQLLWEFCNTFEGLGETCTFQEIIEYNGKFDKITKLRSDPMKTLDFEQSNFYKAIRNPLPWKRSVIDDIGIIICAGSRYQYLNEALNALLTCAEIRKENVFVVVGVDFRTQKPDRKTITFLTILGIPYQIVLQNTTIKDQFAVKQFNFMYYKEAWSAALKFFPGKSFLAFIDEDVAVQKDWLKLLSHAAPLLKRDPSLWCVTGTAANILGKFPNKLMRGWRQVGWGFLLRSEDVAKTVEIWPSKPTFTTLFDVWLLKEVSRERECVYPSVSHTHHFGIGLNIIPELHERHFIREPLSNGNTSHYTPKNLLLKSNYQNFVNDSIRRSKPLLNDPCGPGFLDNLNTLSDYVFYFSLQDMLSAPEWTFLAECIGTWPYSTHGMHEGTMQLPLPNDRILWLVGVPFSPYSSYKPYWCPVWEPGSDDDFIERQSKFTMQFYDMPNLSGRSFEHMVLELFH